MTTKQSFAIIFFLVAVMGLPVVVFWKMPEMLKLESTAVIIISRSIGAIFTFWLVVFSLVPAIRRLRIF